MKTCSRRLCLRNPQLCERAICEGLPTIPTPEIGTILVTGASGYVGGRLVAELIDRGYRVRAMVRRGGAVCRRRFPEAQVVEADARDPEMLDQALKGVHTAYYLIHSLLLGPKAFTAADLEAARIFREAAERANIQRIIYLGGLGDRSTRLSDHLQSRREVGEALQRGRVPVTVFRAAIILGSGSASYEIIDSVVRKMPIILLPLWMRRRCQPISIRDVLKYLIGALEVPATTGRSFDIGSDQVFSYRELLKEHARILSLKRWFVPSWIRSPAIYSYVLSLITPVAAPIIRALMEGLRNDVVCQEEEIKLLLPFKTLSLEAAVRAAINRQETDAIATRWSDSYPRAHGLAMTLEELPSAPDFKVSYFVESLKTAPAIFNSCCQVGGKTGWFQNNWAWDLRGKLDRILLGVGTSRGRKSYSRVDLDDVIDFWRVEAIDESRRLLLRSEMKMPGLAWLEFRIQPAERGNRLIVSSFFKVRSIWGRIYWYFFWPFHHVIFRSLIRQIEKRAH